MNINFLLKFINKKKYLEQRLKKSDSDLNFYNRNIKDRIVEITSNIEKKENLNFTFRSSRRLNLCFTINKRNF